MTIARLSNHRNPHIAILALSLLDTLVQSCGYPFHLQISTKEFLNELVRRFPERPPPFPGPIMSRILDLIHGWKEGICADSRWKEDLGNIRDMHRLLTFKGYRFRDLSKTTTTASTVTAVCGFFLGFEFRALIVFSLRILKLLKSWRKKTELRSLPSFKNSFDGGHLEILQLHKN